MSGRTNHRFESVRLTRTIAMLSFFWTAVVALSLVCNVFARKQETLEIARAQARTAFEKDLVYRLWNAEHGGVYVPVTEKTTSNPYLEHIPERDITTTTGRVLTLVNPAFMTRQVHKLSTERFGVHGHITSLNLLRPGNAPDPWERKVLESFEEGGAEVTSLEEIDGKPYMRLMRSLVTEERCLKCHKDQGYKVGDVRGGISVSIPMEPLRRAEKTAITPIVLGHGLLWIFGLAGLVLGTRNLKRSIASRERAEKKEREGRFFLQSVIDGNQDAMIVIDQNYRVVLANKAARKQSGRGDPAAARLTCHHAFHRRDVPCDQVHGTDIQCPLKNVLTTKAPAMVRHIHIDSEGKEYHVEVAAAPIFNEAGEVVQVVESFRDITDRLRFEEEQLLLERQFLEAQKMESLGILAGGIAHDFNNLLMAVLGYADLALNDLSPASPARKSVIEIEKGARRAADLTRQMLAYSGRGRFVVEVVDLSDVVAEMIHLFQASLPKKISLNLDIQPDLPLIEADVTQVQQVVMNLITNASEAIGEEAGTITISSGTRECSSGDLAQSRLSEKPDPGLFVAIGVTDTGCGMDGETLTKLFDPFFTTKFTGHGLGLAAVLGIMRAHKGAIIVSSNPGVETTFQILFPAAKGKVKSKREKRDREKDGWKGEGTVLVIDDERSVCELVRLMLELIGFSVLTAKDGEEGVEVFRRRRDEIVCVLLDMTMPRMSGEETFRALREIRSDVKVILSSGYNEQEVVRRFVGLGLAGFIQKPYRLVNLAETMREVLER